MTGRIQDLFSTLKIESPKRSSSPQGGWEGFFPYYAGFPEAFAKSILSNLRLSDDSLVVDPWNGSGTTTYVSTSLGLPSLGLDLNPVMVVIAKARVLPSSESDSLLPLGHKILQHAEAHFVHLGDEDPLGSWFGPKAGGFIRSVERAICGHLLGTQTLASDTVHLEHMSGMAATHYAALFSVCRRLAKAYQSTNPTWLRHPRPEERRVHVQLEVIRQRFITTLTEMTNALKRAPAVDAKERISPDIRLADTSNAELPNSFATALLTSPPYCTRIDYTAATRIELAILSPLLSETSEALGRRMTGSTRVPTTTVQTSPEWGDTCLSFLDRLRIHPAKASGGYYYKTHVDYFDKLSRSLKNCSKILKTGAPAVIVVQDSFYKDIHNDLPTILTEIAKTHGLDLKRREDFHIRRSMSGINPRARAYNRPAGANEAVLCFVKRGGELSGP